jgi:hypothetical protein
MMTQQELTQLNIGQSLDNLMNLDPRGYGVCRILYDQARKKAGEPLSVHCAKELAGRLKEGSLVYIITGFILLPHGHPETDGLVGSMLLARSLVTAFGAKPLIICPEECLPILKNLAPVAGLHLYNSIKELLTYPIAVGAVPFTKDRAEAAGQAQSLIAEGLPAAVISTEAPGANARGVYHNATGKDVTDLEAKSDILFEILQQKGVLNIAIGDLGNEIGMAAISETLKTYIPYGAGTTEQDSIAVVSAADHLITATVSDWGANALIAALALVMGTISIMHSEDIEREAIVTASRAGAVDMYGWLSPAIDGMGVDVNMSIAALMRALVENALKTQELNAHWFDKTLALGWFEKNH